MRRGLSVSQVQHLSLGRHRGGQESLRGLPQFAARERKGGTHQREDRPDRERGGRQSVGQGSKLSACGGGHPNMQNPFNPRMRAREAKFCMFEGSGKAQRLKASTRSV